jgi:hypothetical protein
MATCVFCGFEGRLSREHVWPQWVRRHAFEEQGISTENISRYWFTRERPGTAPLKSTDKKGASRLSLVSRHACEMCNKGWMSDLERRIIPVLGPMMDGRSTELSAIDLKALRAWAVKTALSFAYANRGRLSYSIPASLAHDLYAGRLTDDVPDGAQVWVAWYDPLGAFAYRHMLSLSQGGHPVAGARHLLLRVVFIAAHSVFYVRLPDDRDARWMLNALPLQNFTPIFAVSDDRSIAWQKDALDDTQISRAFNRHIHAGIYEGQEYDTWLAPEGADEPAAQ